jgi:hypothetical protein
MDEWQRRSKDEARARRWAAAAENERERREGRRAVARAEVEVEQALRENAARTRAFADDLAARLTEIMTPEQLAERTAALEETKASYNEAVAGVASAEGLLIGLDGRLSRTSDNADMEQLALQRGRLVAQIQSAKQTIAEHASLIADATEALEQALRPESRSAFEAQAREAEGLAREAANDLSKFLNRHRRWWVMFLLGMVGVPLAFFGLFGLIVFDGWASEHWDAPLRPQPPTAESDPTTRQTTTPVIAPTPGGSPSEEPPWRPLVAPWRRLYLDPGCDDPAYSGLLVQESLLWEPDALSPVTVTARATTRDGAVEVAIHADSTVLETVALEQLACPRRQATVAYAGQRTDGLLLISIESLPLHGADAPGVPVSYRYLFRPAGTSHLERVGGWHGPTDAVPQTYRIRPPS